MSAQPADISRPSIAKNQALVIGRVTAVKTTDNGRFTEITIPAADEYSSPQVVEVASAGILGRIGEDVSIKVALGGWKRKFNRADGTKGYEVKNAIRAIEV